MLALAVCCLSGARALVAAGRADLALRLPYGADAVMRGIAQGAGSAALHDVALAALHTSPLAAEALATLAQTPDAARRAQLLALAGRLGWRDEAVQRNLYNAAIKAGDFAGAMSHADAILRIWGPQKDLEVSLNMAANVPAFRKALAPYLRNPSRWSRRWLVLSVSALSDEAIVELAKSVPTEADENAFETATQVMWGLVKQGRAVPALEIDLAIRGRVQRLPMLLEWPDPSRNPESPFAWQLGKGYAIASGLPKRLTSHGVERTSLTYRLLALEPGDYAMELGRGQQAPGTWQWAMGCGSEPVAGSWALEATNEFSVEADCPVQWIALRGDLTSAPLDTMTIQSLSPDLL